VKCSYLMKTWNGFGERTGKLVLCRRVVPDSGDRYWSQSCIVTLTSHLIVVFERLVSGSLHCLLQLDVRLGLGHDLSHPSNVVF